MSSRNFQLKLLLEEPLEVVGNGNPRYMIVLDRIRLIGAQNTEGNLGVLHFALRLSSRILNLPSEGGSRYSAEDLVRA